MTSTIKVNTIQNTCGADIIKESSNTITIGASGDTVTLASGASQTGFGREGSVDWQTSSIKTSTFTASSGEGYFINQSSAIEANLPSGTAGAIVAFADYARNFATYNLTINPNGTQKIGGVNGDTKLTVDGQAATFVYVDDTKGWINVQNAEDTEVGAPPFISATGGSIAESGNFKIHTFTGPGTFCVSRTAPGPSGNPNNVDYVVVGGGGGGGAGGGPGSATSGASSGGGGAGGYRESPGTATCYTASPKGASPAAAIAVTVQGYPIAVGGAGGGVTPGNQGDDGSASSALGIASAGGGGGGSRSAPSCGFDGRPGGSGGGAVTSCTAGTGNTPPVNPPQGNNGGAGPTSVPNTSGGGGGGATAVGQNNQPGSGGGIGGAGGAGATSCITASPVARAGGGGGGGGGDVPSGHDNAGGAGGTGGGGTGGRTGALGTAGTANTGGGGGGGGSHPGKNGKGGGSGVVIIRYKFQ